MLPIDVVDRICRLVPAKDRVRFRIALSIKPTDTEFFHMKKLEVAERFVEKQRAKKSNYMPKRIVEFLTSHACDDAYARSLLELMGVSHDYSDSGIYGLKRDLKNGKLGADKQYKIGTNEAGTLLETLCVVSLETFLIVEQNESLRPVVESIVSYPLICKFVMRVVESSNKELFAYFVRELGKCTDELKKRALTQVASYDFLSFDLFHGNFKLTTLVAKYLTIPRDVLQKLIDKAEELLLADAAFALESLL